jgi:hypothetical protein
MWNRYFHGGNSWKLAHNFRQCNDTRFLVGSIGHIWLKLPEFSWFFHRLGGKEILWGKRNFGDCKRIFERAVVEALYHTPNSLWDSTLSTTSLPITNDAGSGTAHYWNRSTYLSFFSHLVPSGPLLQCFENVLQMAAWTLCHNLVNCVQSSACIYRW